MPVGTVQLFDNCLNYLLDDGDTIGRWDTEVMAWTLWQQAGADPADTVDDFTGLDVTHNQNTDGDYVQQAVNTKTVVNTSGVVEFRSAIANFGSAVTITTKYLVLFDGTAGSLVGTNKCLFWCDLDTTSNTAQVTSTNSDFTVDDAADGWFKINKQA